MPAAFFRQIKHALRHLKPTEVRAEASRPVRVGLMAPSAEALGRMEAYFAPPFLTAERRAEALALLVRGGGPGADIVICDSSLLPRPGAFSFDPEHPEPCLQRIIEQRGELKLALARRLYPFRKPVSYHVIRSVAKENALFCLATALPDVIPSFLTLPWMVGAYGSDSAFLSMNQVRMAFLLAAASDRPVGYREQKSEIGSILASSFGWRALARELVGKIPLGGGLIPKAAVAWAGTWAVGLSLERLYRLGYGFTRQQRRAVYEEAFEHGKQVVAELLESFKKEREVHSAG